MQKYKIEYSYRTGDTFGSSDRTDTLEYVWTSLKIAKENLVRIQEHWIFYSAKESAYRYTDNKKKKLIDEACTKPWYNKNYHESLFLKKDNGEEFLFYPIWCGYFESLYGAEIIEDMSDRKISFR